MVGHPYPSGGWWLSIFDLLGGGWALCLSKGSLSVGVFSFFETKFFSFFLRRPGLEIN